MPGLTLSPALLHLGVSHHIPRFALADGTETAQHVQQETAPSAAAHNDGVSV